MVACQFCRRELCRHWFWWRGRIENWNYNFKPSLLLGFLLSKHSPPLTSSCEFSVSLIWWLMVPTAVCYCPSFTLKWLPVIVLVTQKLLHSLFKYADRLSDCYPSAGRRSRISASRLTSVKDDIRRLQLQSRRPISPPSLNYRGRYHKLSPWTFPYHS